MQPNDSSLKGITDTLNWQPNPQLPQLDILLTLIFSLKMFMTVLIVAF